MTPPIGLGLDMVEVDRVAAMIARHGDRGLRRVLTDAEAAYCRECAAPARHAAARIAAKEAAFKALGALGSTIYVGWQEIEVERDASGVPRLRFHGRGAEATASLGVTGAVLSITHTNRDAAAAVVLTR
jgi:holo-[acyl-carrier protein] synthase